MTSISQGRIIALVHNENMNGTYKLALLRAMVELCLFRPSQFSGQLGGPKRAQVGLLVDKWLEYYWPLAKQGVRQLKGVEPGVFARLRKFAEANEARSIKSYAAYRANLEAGHPANSEFKAICRILAARIVDKPMRHLGYMGGKSEYAVAGKVPGSKAAGNLAGFNWMIYGFGEFELRPGYFEAFQRDGYHLLGLNTILGEWYAMSRKLNQGGPLSEEAIFRSVTGVSEDELDRANLRSLLGKGLLDAAPKTCVWTGSKPNALDWDHVLPWSVTRSNALWNLAPADPRLNRWEKRAEIPGRHAFKKAEENFMSLWASMLVAEPIRFRFETSLDFGDLRGLDEGPLKKGLFEAICSRAENLAEAGFAVWEG